jgi:hypothetical protein
MNEDYDDRFDDEGDTATTTAPPPSRQLARVENPFGEAQQSSSGALATQSREVAETQTKFLMAERFPRDERKAMDRITNSFTRPGLAEKSQYAYSRGGTDINGPSIHAAQAIAQGWGNIEFGWRELSRGEQPNGKRYSEVEAYAIDLQSRVPARISFIVIHWRDTKKGGYALKDERDIYELCSNMAQRRKRACILQVMPADVIETAMQQAAVTLKATADTTPAGIAKMLGKFAPYGVKKEHIEALIQRRIESITAAQVVRLRTIFASLEDDMSEPKDWFDMTIAAAPPPGGTDPETGEVPPPPPANPVDAAKDALRKRSGKSTPPAASAPKTDAPPSAPKFDAKALAEKMRNTTDRDALALMADDCNQLPDGPEKQELFALFRQRDAELAEGK